MSERSYTVKEIDELRHACETRWLFGTSVLKGDGPYQGRSYKEGEMVKCVEELVRTHMLAGHIAQDIYNVDKEKGPA